jgi:hypothetical protein
VEQRHMLRPMGLLEIIDQAFRLYRANFWLLTGVLAVVYIPLGVLAAVPGIGTLASVLSPIANLLATGALIKLVSDKYLGKALSIGEGYRYIAKRLWPAITTTVSVYLLMILGMLALGVGAIVAAFWAAFTMQVFVIEDKRNFSAIWRSKFLIGQGVWAQVFVLYLIVGTIALLCAGLLYPALGISFMRPEMGGSTGLLAMGLANGILETLIGPLTVIAIIMLYYDSRIRKEGFDLQMLAQELGEQLPPAAVAPVDVVAPPSPTTPEDGSQV